MILIVDDRQENIFSLQKLLELHSFDVDTALSGEEALRKVLKNEYALIILDVQMPEMDGFEVAEALSGYRKAKDIPIIFLSAVNTEKKFIAKGYNSGGIDYVVKPFDPDLLLLKVKTFYRLYEQTLALNNIQKKLEDEIEIRKNAENELQTRYAELSSVLESIPQMAFTASTNGEIEYVNKEWKKYAPLKNSFPVIQNHHSSFKNILAEAIQSHQNFITEISLQEPHSNNFQYHLFAMMPIKKGELIIKWVGILTNIHEQKMLSDILEKKVNERTVELIQSNKDLENLNNELRQFAWIASHDLQEPLRKIHVFSSVLKDKFLAGNETAQHHINKVIQSSARLMQLVNDLLTYTAVSVQTMHKKVELDKIVADVLIDLELLIREKNALIHVGQLPCIDMIPVHATQLFQNILSNALKYSRKEVQPVISVTAENVDALSLTAMPDSNGKYTRIIIADNGIGFNEDYLEKIFSIFQRLHSTHEYEGTGVGLAIVKKIIDKHHGLISAHSRESEGAAFTLVLPLHQNEKEFAHNQTQEY